MAEQFTDLPFADKPVFLQNAFRTHIGGFRSVRDAAFVSMDFTLDVLNGCEHKCPGCFVQRKNDFMEDDLKVVESIVDQALEAGYDFNEMFIGPTDLFSAINYDELITSETFKRFAHRFTLTANTTLMNDSSVIEERLNLLRKEQVHEGRNKELFVILDLDRYIKNDWFYMNQLNRNLKLVYDWNVFFIVNVYSEDMFDGMDLTEMTLRLKKDFGTKLRINPSYFRGTNKKHVERYANDHKRMLESQVNEENIGMVFLNMIDIYFSSFTLLSYGYSKGKLSIAPFIYEVIPQDNEMFDIKKAGSKYTLADIESTHYSLLTRQYEYATKTTECSDCKFLPSCSSRNILAYMESRNITDCFLPKQLFRDASIGLEKRLMQHQIENSND